MAGVVHALDYLAQAKPSAPQPLTVLFGDEWLLRNLVLEGLRTALFADEVIPHETFDGDSGELEWRDVRDEVSTVSLFGQGKPRLAVIQSADKFVSEYRSELEKYAAHASSHSVLVLVLKVFAANTRLYKLVQKEHLVVDCRVPEVTVGWDKVPDARRIVPWLTSTAETRHRATLPKRSAELLLNLVGADFGRLDNELEKIAIYVGEGKKITEEVVTKLVGGERAETTWDMIEAILDGEADRALEKLDRLLNAGENPNALFGSLAWSLRRFAAAVRLIERGERSGQRIPLPAALRKAGVNDRKGKEGFSERHLKQLGRIRAGHLYRSLLELDLSLKGSHSQGDRARWAFEQLILRLSKELAPNRRS